MITGYYYTGYTDFIPQVNIRQALYITQRLLEPKSSGFLQKNPGLWQVRFDLFKPARLVDTIREKRQ